MRTIIHNILRISIREIGFMRRNPIYLTCAIIFPLLAISFFTSLMSEGQPQQIPIGIIDNDHTPTTQKIALKLESLQGTKITSYYTNTTMAREAVQRGEIYAYLLIPKGTTKKLFTKRQPIISFYYSNVTLVAGGMTFKDLKTITALIAASVGVEKLSMLGKTSREIRSFLQPIALDIHMIQNPWLNYNVYLSTIMIPGVLSIFMLLLTVYTIGKELKFDRSKVWLRLANNNIIVALIGKLLPLFLIFLIIFWGFEWYIYGYLCFPHAGGWLRLLSLGLLMVTSSIGFGVFVFGLIPSLRMAMSVCSLWGVLGFSVCGATFPLFAMDPIIQGIAQIVPLRHYWMIYQASIFNGYPITDVWYNVMILLIFAVLPLLVIFNIKRAMLNFVYIP